MNKKQFKILCYFLWRIATNGKMSLLTFEEEYALANTIATDCDADEEDEK